MRGANLEDTQITEYVFDKSNLAYATLNNATIENSIFDNVTLAPLKYENLQADPRILNDIQLASTVAEVFTNRGYDLLTYN